MPILEAIQDHDSDLSQGDVLKGVEIVVSVAGPGAEPDIEGESAMVLVVSRDCVIEHKDSVLVAPLKPFPFKKGEIEAALKTLDGAVKVLSTIRDGYYPDSLYLGTLPGADAARYSAKLDAVTPLRVPKEVVIRKKWLNDVRIARLSEDFRRTLPVRFFWALAKVGFDDHSWFCTEDLELVVNAANVERVNLESAVATATANVTAFSVAGEAKAQKLVGLEAARDAALVKLADFDKTVAPFKEELARRNVST